MKKATLSLLAFLFAIGAFAQSKDLIGVPGPIKFDGHNFFLGRVTTLSPGHYLQEYVPRSQKAGKHDSILVFEVYTEPMELKKAVDAKTAALNKRKLTDDVLHQELLPVKGKDEYVIDFIQGEEREHHYMELVEWNAYRYKKYKTKTGKESVIMFGIGTRAYGNNYGTFFPIMNETKAYKIIALKNYNVPKTKFEL